MSKPKKKKTNQKHKTSENPSSAAVIDNSINKAANCTQQQHNAQKPQNTDNESQWDKERNWEWTGVVINAILAVFTILLYRIAVHQTDAAKDSLKVLKESLMPKVDIDTTNVIFNRNIEVTKPQVIIKNFGNLKAKDVTISIRADLRYDDVPDDSVMIFEKVKEKKWNQIYAGDRKYLDIPLSRIEAVKKERETTIGSDDTRPLFLHFIIT